ncbi:MAG: FAD-dependent oxidoreductase, partial [Sphingorhabdus sp.]
DPGKWSQWVSFTKAAGKPVLLGFTGADTAKAVEAMDDRAIVAEAMAAVRTMFGNSAPDPVAVQMTRWSRDPFALGSYSYNAVGSTPADRKALAAPEVGGALAFAGEACSADYPGTVHGALLSGSDAVRKLLD